MFLVNITTMINRITLGNPTYELAILFGICDPVEEEDVSFPPRESAVHPSGFLYWEPLGQPASREPDCLPFSPSFRAIIQLPIGYCR